MHEFSSPIQHQEVGVRFARTHLPELLSSVLHGDRVVYITRHGRRVAALVGADTAHTILASQDGGILEIPDGLADAVKIVELFLIGDASKPAPLLRGIDSNLRKIACAALLLAEYLIAHEALYRGDVPIAGDSGEVVNKRTVAEIVLRGLHEMSKNGFLDPSLLPIIAGGIWAAQARVGAVKYREAIPLAITPHEVYMWYIVLRDVCMLINAYRGDGVAEGILYEFEEIFRRSKN